MSAESQSLAETWRTFSSFEGDPLAKALYARRWGGATFALVYLAFYWINWGLVLVPYSVLWQSELAEQIRWGLRPTNILFSMVVPPLVAAFYYWISDAPRRLIIDLLRSDVFKNLSGQHRAQVSSKMSSTQRLFSYPGWTIASLAVGFISMPVISVLIVVELAIAPPGEHDWVGALFLVSIP